MIEIRNLTKRFDKVTAVENLSVNIESGVVVGLVGSNGGGKSTLLRLLSGIFAADSGSIIIDGQDLYNNAAVKGTCFFVPDFPFYYDRSTINNTASLYRDLYPNWSEQRFEKLCSMFPVGRDSKIINMSKGMQRQAAIILALSTCPKYLFMDEIFDGLDPVMRLLLKKLIIEQVSELIEDGVDTIDIAVPYYDKELVALKKIKNCARSSARFRSRFSKFRLCQIFLRA